MLRRAIAPYAWSMGCCITVIVSGPMPDQGGAIGSFAVHEGTNVLGHNFAQITPNFRNAFARPHVQFAKGVYPEDVRKRRTLPASVTGIPVPEVDATQPSVTPTPPPAPSPIIPRVVATPMVILDERDKVTRPCRPPMPGPSSLPPAASVSDPLHGPNPVAPDIDLYSFNPAQEESLGMGASVLGMGSMSLGMENTSFGMGSSALPNADQPISYDDFGMPIAGSFTDSLNDTSFLLDHSGFNNLGEVNRYIFPDSTAGLSNTFGFAGTAAMSYPDLSAGLTVPNAAAAMHAFPGMSNSTTYPNMSPRLGVPAAPSNYTFPSGPSSLLQSFAPPDPSVQPPEDSPTHAVAQTAVAQTAVAQTAVAQTAVVQTAVVQTAVAQTAIAPPPAGDDGDAAVPGGENATDAQDGIRRATRARRKPNKADEDWQARPRTAAGKENHANKKRKVSDMPAEGGGAKKRRKATPRRHYLMPSLLLLRTDCY
ncbi:hypothetical protein C8T65DRAFT_701967 [Cerioporus squamosus]|nr:hypothetical protein C8T65DRAFT_701967 [Cerioporus squamosus]